MRSLLTTFLLASPVLAADTDWPHWRGPNADGTAPHATPPLTWDAATGKNVRWAVPLIGRGSATPIVWGDQVFIVSAERTDREAKPTELPESSGDFEKRTTAPKVFHRFLVTSYDRATGTVRWQRVAAEKVPHEGHHETHTYAAGSPTTDGERLYVSFGSFGVYCYDLTGKPLWERDLGRLNTRLGWGEAVTAVVHRDNLLLNWDQEANSALYCLDAKTGKTRWKADRDEHSTWTTPLVVEYQGKTQVIVNGTTRVRSHDLATGTVIWSVGGMTVNPIPSAVRFGDSVIIVSGYRGAMAAAVPLSATGDADAAVRWRYDKGTPYVPSPVIAAGRVYFTNENKNLLTALDAATGKPVIDRARLPNVGDFYASPVFAGGRLYFTDRAGTTLVLKPSDKLDVLATNKLGDAVDASPVAAGRQLFLRGERKLYCLEERTTARSLFDGKSLAGWEGDTAKTWRVENGAIVGGSLETKVPRNEFLCTTAEYGDFELRVSFKLEGDRAGANGGVQFRTKRIPNHHEVSGYQADVGQDYWGALYDESRRNKVLAKPAKELVQRIAKFDDWNEYRIRAEGPRIRLWLNGELTVDYTEADAVIARTGIIGLQIHGGAKARVAYKDIVIEELSVSASP
ncbi:MAG: family 16 glycoside hydrolase [Gemmataceae bacterium]